MGPVEYIRQSLKLEALPTEQRQREILKFSRCIRVFHYSCGAEQLAPHGGGLSVKMVLRGAETFTLGARRVRLLPGEALLMPPDVEYGSEIARPTETFSAFFPPALCLQLAQGARGDALEPAEAGALSRNPPLAIAADAHLRGLLDAARRHLQASDWARGEEVLQETAAHLVLTAGELRGAEEKLTLLRETARRELLRRLQRARAYLHDHPDQQVPLDRLAEACQVSRFHLLRCFRDAFGCTPAQYQAELRMQRAARLLRHNPVAEVARMLGYRSPSAFTRAWKRRHGQAPTDSLRTPAPPT